MTVLIDLAEVPTAERAMRWSQTIKGKYLDVEVGFRGTQYPTGKIVRTQAGLVGVTAASSVAQFHQRTEAMAERDGIDFLVAVVQYRGRTHTTQSGRNVDLQPGQLVLLSTAEPYRIDYLDEHDMLYLAFPRALFLDVAHNPTHVLNTRVDERHGSTLIADYFRQVAGFAHRISPDQQERMCAFGIGLLAEAALRAMA